jgi:hypothetical protein
MATLSDNAVPQRDRLRLHRSTWLVVLLAATGLFLLVVPGELVYIDFGTHGARAGFEHGWPWDYLRREVNVTSLNRPTGPPWLQKSAWSVRNDPPPAAKSQWQRDSFFRSIKLDPAGLDAAFVHREPLGWRWEILLADGFVFLASLVVLVAALERRHRRRRLWQISLAESLCLMLFASVAFAWWETQKVAMRRFTAQMKYVEQVQVNVESHYIGPTWLSRAVGRSNLLPLRDCVYLGVGMRAEMPKVVELMPNLENLDFMAPLREEDLPHLIKLQNLRGLMIAGWRDPPLTDDMLAWLRQLPRLESLVFPAKEITDDGLAHLKDCPQLGFVSIGDPVKITAEGLRHLESMPRLKGLVLSAPGIGDGGWECIARMTQLESLGLYGKLFDARGLPTLSKLNRLRELQLVNPDIAQRDLVGLLDCQALELLIWNGEKVVGRENVQQFLRGDDVTKLKQSAETK